MRNLLVYILLIITCPLMALEKDSVVMDIDINKIEGKINPHLYGFLLEHLYHSVSNGIWGENVWNRSFEETLADGKWTIDTKGNLTLLGKGTSQSLFHITKGNDYQLSLDVKRIAGDGCIIIGVRDQYRDKMLTNRIYLHIGGESSGQYDVACHTGWIWHTPRVLTKIEKTKKYITNLSDWNKIRIKCIGSRITIWQNDNLIFDKEIENCPKDGAITIGAENCDVQFRNISVVDNHLKPLSLNLNVTRHWNMVGDCETTIDPMALNHHLSLKVSNIGKWAGIEQPARYYVRRNDPISGSVYLKGDVSSLDVMFLKNKKILAKQHISSLSPEWKRYDISLPVKQDLRDVSLRIQTNEKGSFCIDQVSLMHLSSIDNQGFRKELSEAISTIRPTMLRWPGGSFSEQYRFEHGIGRQTDRKGILRWDDFDPLSFGTDEYISFCRKIGAEPLIVIPIGYHNYAGYAPDKDGKEDWLQRALDWMEYCNGDANSTHWGAIRAKNGHPEPYHVKYWEIDNEVWKMDPHLYAQLTRIFSIAMKKKDPGIKIIGCGCGRLGAEGIGLDSIMIHEVGEYIDYISPHYYQTIDKYGHDGVEEYGRYLDKLAKWIAHSKNPDMRIYVSEWNLDGVDMRTGLFAGGFLNRLEKSPYVEMAAPALFLRHLSAPAWNNAFINFDQDRFFTAPNYVVMRLWRDHFLPNRVAFSISSNQLNINATASDDKKKICVKVVNPSPHPVCFTIKKGLLLGKSQWQVIKSDHLDTQNTLEDTERIHVEDYTVDYEGDNLKIKIPSYSASVLSFKR